MDKLSIIQLTLMVQFYLESSCSVARTQKAFRRNCGNINHLSPRCIHFNVANFKALGRIADRQDSGRSRTVSIDNIESVRQDVTHIPQKS